MEYIYTRVSTDMQTNGSQLISLSERFPGATVIEETCSGAKNRPILKELVSSLMKGDVLIVAALDRLGRSTLDVLGLIEALERRGVILKSMREGVDYSTPSGRLVTQILCSVAELERSIISERVKQGLVKAKANGKQLGGKREGAGRKAKTVSHEDLAKIKRMSDKGLSTHHIAEVLGYSQNKVWRLLKQAA